MGCIIPTMHCRSQHRWKLLHPLAHHCQHARNNSQHCWRNNVGSCCARLHAALFSLVCQYFRLLSESLATASIFTAANLLSAKFLNKISYRPSLTEGNFRENLKPKLSFDFLLSSQRVSFCNANVMQKCTTIKPIDCAINLRHNT